MAPKKKAAAAAAAPEPAPVEDDVSMGDAPAAAEEGAAQEDDTVSVFDEEQRIRIVRIAFTLQELSGISNSLLIYCANSYPDLRILLRRSSSRRRITRWAMLCDILS